jgi:threonine/homoserine/homoserine lactone efflux protein
MVPVVFPDSTAVWLFCLAAQALLAIPGPAVMYVVVQSAEQGRRVGLASVAVFTSEPWCTWRPAPAAIA